MTLKSLMSSNSPQLAYTHIGGGSEPNHMRAAHFDGSSDPELIYSNDDDTI
jgi:hypothetical protein